VLWWERLAYLFGGVWGSAANSGGLGEVNTPFCDVIRDAAS